MEEEERRVGGIDALFFSLTPRLVRSKYPRHFPHPSIIFENENQIGLIWKEGVLKVVFGAAPTLPSIWFELRFILKFDVLPEVAGPGLFFFCNTPFGTRLIFDRFWKLQSELRDHITDFAAIKCTDDGIALI